MRITIFILLATILQTWANDTYSQKTRLSLEVTSQKLVDVLDEIENQTEFFFLYNEKLIDTDRTVSIFVNNQRIDEILQELFAETDVVYTITDRKIILAPSFLSETDQQQNSVSGTVTDESGQTLPGVTVLVKGSTQGTVTNTDGYYSLTNISENATLVFSFVGMSTVEVPVGTQRNIDVTMGQDFIGLDEVIAIGYQTRQKRSITGSVGTTTGAEIEAAATPDLQESLQGKVAGLVINDRGGEPGDKDLEIFIRGKSTFGSNAPLIVVNGVPRSSFASLAPNDIASISILKDASAAIYGARAANGVILIETKQGRKGAPSISLQSEYGFQMVAEFTDMMNSYQRAIYHNEGFQYVGAEKEWTDEAIEHFRLGDKPLEYPDTDWFDEMTDARAPQTHHNLSVTGGSERVNYYTSIDYLYQDNLAKGKDQDYKQYQVRSNISIQVLDNLTVGTEFEGRIEKTRWFSNYVTPWDQIQSQYPWTVAQWPDGKLGPVTAYAGLGTMMRDKSGFDDTDNKIINLKLDFNYDMSWITNGLELSGYANYARSYGDNRNYVQPWTVYNRNHETGEYYEETATIYSGSLAGKKAVYSRSASGLTDFYHIRLSYENSFNLHKISAFAAYEQSESWNKNLWAYRMGLPSGKKPYLWAGQDAERDNGESLGETGRVNYFGSVGYNYANKYMIDFTMRYDGSFNFPKDSRFGLFPGVSVAYNVSEEPFMNNLTWLDVLKVRVSYAEMGNDAVPQYQYLSLYKYGGRDNNLSWNSNNYSFVVSPSLNKGFQLRYTPNPDITWEVSKNQNIGLDVTIYNGLFDFTFDAFKERRSNILLSRSAEIPVYTALQLPDENIGEVENKGLEFSLRHTNKIGSVEYSIGGNITYTRNKVIYMAEPENVKDYQKRTGLPMDSWYLYKTDGLFLTEEDLASSPKLAGSQLGDIKYVDMNGDGEITGDDMYRKHTSQTPEIVFSFNPTVSYKGLKLDLFFQGQTRAETSVFSNYHWNAELFEGRWTPGATDAKFPRAFERWDFWNERISDFWLYDATFLRLKNVTLSYTLPSAWVDAINISRMQVYVRGRNVYTWHKMFAGFDPERRGWDNSLYATPDAPPLSRYIVGVNIDF